MEREWKGRVGEKRKNKKTEGNKKGMKGKWKDRRQREWKRMAGGAGKGKEGERGRACKYDAVVCCSKFQLD